MTNQYVNIRYHIHAFYPPGVALRAEPVNYTPFTAPSAGWCKIELAKRKVFRKNMKTQVFYVSEKILIEAIRHLYPDKIKQKDYEYPVSIYVKRIFEKHYNKHYQITFELNTGHQGQNRPLSLTADETVKILRHYLKENTDIDFGLAPIGQNEKFEGYAYPFQVKRFIGFSKENYLKELAEFIRKKSNHYRSLETSLIIIPEFSLSKKDISKAKMTEFSEEFYKTLAKQIRLDKPALRSILLFSIKSETYSLTQIWPNYGEYK